MAGPQYVYHMQGFPRPTRAANRVLEYSPVILPDSKSGVVGVNGAGKSTLLMIMAGVETEFNGEAWAADSARSQH